MDKSFVALRFCNGQRQGGDSAYDVSPVLGSSTGGIQRDCSRNAQLLNFGCFSGRPENSSELIETPSWSAFCKMSQCPENCRKRSKQMGKGLGRISDNFRSTARLLSRHGKTNGKGRAGTTFRSRLSLFRAPRISTLKSRVGHDSDHVRWLPPCPRFYQSTKNLTARTPNCAA